MSSFLTKVVCDFLGSTHGRHFADEVSNQLARGLALDTAIRTVINVFQGWRTDRITYRRHSIPAGLPYLTGWVGYYEAQGGEV